VEEDTRSFLVSCVYRVIREGVDMVTYVGCFWTQVIAVIILFIFYFLSDTFKLSVIHQDKWKGRFNCIIFSFRNST